MHGRRRNGIRLREAVGRAVDAVSRADVAVAGTTRARMAALTFDDGPSPANTLPLLELLGCNGARATFFAVGAAVARHDEIVRAIADGGSELGNHTYSHPHTVALGDDELRDELRRTSDALRAATGAAPATARPPYGKDRRRFARIASELGMRTVLWSVESGDTRRRAAGDVVGRVLASTRPGVILLLHDGGDRRPTTLEACSVLVPALRERGYELVTVSELLAA